MPIVSQVLDAGMMRPLSRMDREVPRTKNIAAITPKTYLAAKTRHSMAARCRRCRNAKFPQPVTLSLKARRRKLLPATNFESVLARHCPAPHRTQGRLLIRYSPVGFKRNRTFEADYQLLVCQTPEDIRCTLVQQTMRYRRQGIRCLSGIEPRDQTGGRWHSTTVAIAPDRTTAAARHAQRAFHRCALATRRSRATPGVRTRTTPTRAAFPR